MDTGAEFTLQIARFAQDRFPTPRSAARWHLLPSSDASLTWAAARDVLAALPKPVMVAPLNDPGALGIWLPAHLEATQRAWLEYQLNNQMQYWREKLNICAVSNNDPVVFEPATPALSLTAREFLHWASEYIIGVPVTMDKISDGRGGRILIMPPGGDGPPLGMRDPYATAS